MTRERVIDVYIPVVPAGSGGGIGAVGAIFAAIGAVVVFAVLVCIAVAVAFPAPRHTPTTGCEPFCSQYNPPVSTVGGVR